jgi:hypothetical protein
LVFKLDLHKSFKTRVMNRFKKVSLPIVVLLFLMASIKGQQNNLKKEITEPELKYLMEIINNIAKTDQECRSYLSSKTLDDNIIKDIDSVIDNHGIEAGLKYSQSLNLKLTKRQYDSLYTVQSRLDLNNHILFRGIISTYGYLPDDMLGDKSWVLHILLLHPHPEWDVNQYLADYSALLLPEVKSGRMSAFKYAQFVDNINGKILRKPQIYGTNGQFCTKTNKVLPPGIKDIRTTNRARKSIGLPPLKDGEYRLVK